MIRSHMRRHPLLRFLAINLALGIVIAALAVGGLMVFDTHGLRRLILQDQSPALAVALLAGGFIVTFGGVVMASAVMALGGKRDSGGTASPVVDESSALVRVAIEPPR
jgi:hypothetical protein